MTRTSLLLAVIAALAAVADAVADVRWLPARGSIQVDLSYGYDNNVFRQGSDPGEGGYLPYAVRAEQRILSGSVGALELDASVLGTRYESDLSHGDRTTGRARLTYSRTVLRQGSRQVRVYGKVGFREHRQEFVSRSTGDEIIFDLENDSVSLRSRFDSGTVDAEAVAIVRSVLGLDWRTAFGWRDRDYRNDYDDLPDVESLDYRRWHGSLRATRDLGDNHRLRTQLGVRERDYAETSARDGRGDRTAAATRQWRYRTAELDWRWRTNLRWELGAEITYEHREDLFAGYHDYDQWSVGPRAAVRGGDMECSLAYQVRTRDYPRARVNASPSRELRYDLRHTVAVGLEIGLGPSTSLIGSLRWRSEDVSDDEDDHDRLRGGMGIRWVLD